MYLCVFYVQTKKTYIHTYMRVCVYVCMYVYAIMKVLGMNVFETQCICQKL